VPVVEDMRVFGVRRRKTTRIISKSAGALSYLNATIGRPNFGVEINGRAAQFSTIIASDKTPETPPRRTFSLS